MKQTQENSQYDVIVVGAGNGGLTAALCALEEGKRVLLLEKNLYPGGCAVSFRRGRFEFEASLHELAFVGSEEEPGTVRTLMNRFGIRPEFIILKDAFRAVTQDEDGYDITMPSGYGAFFSKLVREVPEAEESVKKLKKMIKNIKKAIAYFSSGRSNKLTCLLKYRDFIKASSYSLLEVLDSVGMPEKARSLFCTYWPYLGSSPEQIDAMIYLAMFDGYMAVGPALPRHRSYELSCALEHEIEARGGKIRYNTKVEKFLCKDGQVCGVKAGNEEFLAPLVVANLSPETVYTHMLDADALNPTDRKLARARSFGPKFYTVYLGLDKPFESFGIRDYTIFINTASDPGEQYRSMNDFETTPLIINFLNAAIPDASPEGTTLVYITALMEAEADDGLCETNYDRRKREIASILIDRCERALGIDLKNSIEEIEIGTPATFARYLGTPYGTPYGYLMKDWDVAMFRTMHEKEDNQIPGLVFVGASCHNGDGYSSAYLSGQSMVKKALGEMKKKGGRRP